MAKKCNTALVDPPKTAIKRNAFSKDFRVTMSRGFKSFTRRFFRWAPSASHSSFLSLLTAGFEALYGNAIPQASMAEAIVLAVYIPPQAPAPGQALRITFLYSSSSMVPATFSPQASKAETTSSSLSL